MRLQANMDAKPVCIIRYRLTDRAADLLRSVLKMALLFYIVTGREICLISICIANPQEFYDVQCDPNFERVLHPCRLHWIGI